MSAEPELLNAARDPEPMACIAIPGTEHDFRPLTVKDGWYPGKDRTYLRCVWCHGVACGDASEVDPCIEVWHHEPKPHRTATGATWPIGVGPE